MQRLKLNDTFVRTVHPLFHAVRYPDGNGLNLEVFPSKKKIWIYDSTKGPILLGEYPKMKLQDAREKISSLVDLVKTKLLNESMLLAMTEEYSEFINPYGKGEPLHKYWEYTKAEEQARRTSSANPRGLPLRRVRPLSNSSNPDVSSPQGNSII